MRVAFQSGMLEMIAQHHQVMDLTARGFFRFPIQHLVKVIWTGDLV
jgi:hypothetical protein